MLLSDGAIRILIKNNIISPFTEQLKAHNDSVTITPAILDSTFVVMASDRLARILHDRPQQKQ